MRRWAERLKVRWGWIGLDEGREGRDGRKQVVSRNGGGDRTRQRQELSRRSDEVLPQTHIAVRPIVFIIVTVFLCLSVATSIGPVVGMGAVGMAGC